MDDRSKKVSRAEDFISRIIRRRVSEGKNDEPEMENGELVPSGLGKLEKIMFKEESDVVKPLGNTMPEKRPTLLLLMTWKEELQIAEFWSEV